MPNFYPPTNLKIKLVIGDSVVITWDVHNAIEFKAGTKYRIYGPPDNTPGSYALISEVRRPEASIAKIPENTYVRVTTHTPVLGESDPCAPLQIAGPVTLAETKEPIPVAVDTEGRSRNLLVDPETGAVRVLADINTTATSGLATSPKQDEQTALLTLIRDYLAPGLAKENKQDEIINRLVEQITILDNIDVNTQVGNLIISETEITSVAAPNGTKITLPFFKRAKIEQITVLHEFGTAVNFEVKIWRKKISSSEREVLAKFNSYEENRLDVIRQIPYINLDGLDEVTIQIIPDAGTSNQFYVRISGSLAY